MFDGSTTEQHSGTGANALGQVGWYGNDVGNSSQRTHPVAQLVPNAWGLYDTHGNVWEWCEDWYGDYPETDCDDPQGAEDGSSRVVRGGSWRKLPCRWSQQRCSQCS